MFSIRPAQPEDTGIIWGLIRGLAIYEKLEQGVTGSEELLHQHLFGDRSYAECLLVCQADRAIGFALFFHNYSTFLTKPGIYLEDIFVLPEYRGQGAGKQLLQAVTDLAHDRGCGRVEWSVLDWNQPAIDFYQKMGADVLPDWRICRVAIDVALE
jgi:GNAT superfamily N-acetyltransferase